MSEFKGTKGKWEVLNNDILKDFHTKIAKVHPVNINDNLEHKYNALLISKAPEMLLMLQRLRLDYEMIIPYFPRRNEIGNEIEKLIKEATEL